MLAFRPIGERKLESEQSIDKALLGRGVTARGRVFSFLTSPGSVSFLLPL